MKVDEVELRTVRLPFRTPWRTSYGEERERTALLVTVRSDGVEGYGEGVMEPLPRFREESIPGALHLLRDALVPDLLVHGFERPGSLLDRWERWRGNPMAKAALEMAVWDVHARQRGEALVTVLGGGPPNRTAVEVGAGLGLAPAQEIVDRVGTHLAEGYKRLKLKIEPGFDASLVTAVRSAYPDAPLAVDANAAYALRDAPAVQALDAFELAYIEQPLHWDDLSDHATLASTLHTHVCLDESLTSLARVRAALDLGACRVVNLKPGRVGGHQAALRIHDLCALRWVPLLCGGMLETGIGRAHNIHLSALPGFSAAGETSSASRTYLRDVVEQPLEAVGGLMPIPAAGPGIGVTLDRAYVESITDTVERIRRT